MRVKTALAALAGLLLIPAAAGAAPNLAPESVHALAEMIAPLPVYAPLPDDAAALAQTYLDAAYPDDCATPRHLLRGPDEHPAYRVFIAVCAQPEATEGWRINVFLFNSGRTAAIVLGRVTLTDSAGALPFSTF